jgi:hypothetical protein
MSGKIVVCIADNFGDPRSLMAELRRQFKLSQRSRLVASTRQLMTIRLQTNEELTSYFARFDAIVAELTVNDDSSHFADDQNDLHDFVPAAAGCVFWRRFGCTCARKWNTPCVNGSDSPLIMLGVKLVP